MGPPQRSLPISATVRIVMKYNLSLRLHKLGALMHRPKLWPLISLGVFPALEHDTAFQGKDYDLIVDVGANKGQFAAFAVAKWPAAQIICFEPLAGPREKLTHALHRIAPNRTTVRATALGNQNGTSVMHVATREDSSSLLKLGSTQRELFNMDEAGTVSVPVGRLDSEENIFEQGRALLKIDVQGFEYEVLTGAGEKLQDFAAVYVECSFIELYEGQKLAQHVTEILNANGFTEVGKFNVCTANGELVQADILFEKASFNAPNEQTV